MSAFSVNSMTASGSYRPAERGRAVVVHVREDGSESDVTPDNFNVRTRVHMSTERRQ
jgi:hypothetical protein